VRRETDGRGSGERKNGKEEGGGKRMREEGRSACYCSAAGTPSPLGSDKARANTSKGMISAV
jgi:hypothetical protein